MRGSLKKIMSLSRRSPSISSASSSDLDIEDDDPSKAPEPVKGCGEYRIQDHYKIHIKADKVHIPGSADMVVNITNIYQGTVFQDPLMNYTLKPGQELIRQLLTNELMTSLTSMAGSSKVKRRRWKSEPDLAKWESRVSFSIGKEVQKSEKKLSKKKLTPKPSTYAETFTTFDVNEVDGNIGEETIEVKQRKSSKKVQLTHKVSTYGRCAESFTTYDVEVTANGEQTIEVKRYKRMVSRFQAIKRSETLKRLCKNCISPMRFLVTMISIAAAMGLVYVLAINPDLKSSS